MFSCMSSTLAVPSCQVQTKCKPTKYRGINLIDATLKLTTNVITNKFNALVVLAEEQQGFRSGSSCNDAVFVLRQAVENFVVYNKPAYLCFIDLQKAFDRIRLKDVIDILYNRGIP